MDNKLFQAIDHNTCVSTSKVTIDQTVVFLNNVGATNWDSESVDK